MTNDPVLKLSQISKDFGSLRILDSIDLEIEKGTSVSIVGKSGCGKSTLLQIAAGLDSATSGEVFINNQRLSNLSDQKMSYLRNKEIGFIFQNHLLMEDFSPLENILIPSMIDGKKDVNRAKMLLELVGLSDLSNTKVTTLSGGEKQRIAICRALMNHPSIIFADEPTGALDEENAAVVENLLFEMVKKEGCSMLLVTHNLDFANRCDFKYVLSYKRLVNSAL